MTNSVHTDELPVDLTQYREFTGPSQQERAEASVGGFLQGLEPAVSMFVHSAGHPASRRAVEQTETSMS